MPPIVSLAGAYCLAIYLAYKDRFWRPLYSYALIVPGLLLAIRGSRPLSFWFSIPSIDTLFFLLLIVVCLWIIARRGLNLSGCIRANRVLFIFYIYFLLTAPFSFDPLDCSKRVIKDFLCFLAALIILSEKDPVRALQGLSFRVAAFLFPLSLVFAKYFPHLGRGYDMAGNPTYTGVTFQKNQLGQIGLVFGLLLFSELVSLYRNRRAGWCRSPVFLSRSALFVLGGYLMVKSDSKTSLICLGLGMVILGFAPWFSVNGKGPRRLAVTVGLLISFLVIEQLFGVSKAMLKLAGRDATLTGRTEIWELALRNHKNPLIGSGFCMFWDGEAGAVVAESLATLRSAHSGYLEAYLDGGILAVGLLSIFLIKMGTRTSRRLIEGVPIAPISAAFYVIALVYNISESSFFRLDPLWIVFLSAIMVSPLSPSQPRKDRQIPHAQNVVTHRA
jgi:exopolysaccharide production protein ExoQ